MTTQVLFSQMEKSEGLESAVHERIDHVLDKFADTGILSSTVRLQLDHAFKQKGKSLYRVEVLVKSRQFKDIIMKKTGENMYKLLADVSHRLSGVLSRVHARQVRGNRRKTRHTPYLAWARI